MLDYGKDAMELHDVVAVWCAAENPPGKPLTDPWKVQRRAFQVERLVQMLAPFSCPVLTVPFPNRVGEYTRGMLVVDRRDGSEESSVGNNRSTSHASHQDPAPVQVESEPEIQPSLSGVQCVIQTPGPSVLLNLILSRIWGVDVD
jgi:hypothetical protein